MQDILVVDDEPSVRRTLQQLLEAEGFSCAVVESARKARALLNEDEFRLILCDIRMPGESGLDLLEDIKVAYPDTAVVMAAVGAVVGAMGRAMAVVAAGAMVVAMELGMVVVGAGEQAAAGAVANAQRRVA